MITFSVVDVFQLFRDRVVTERSAGSFELYVYLFGILAVLKKI